MKLFITILIVFSAEVIKASDKKIELYVGEPLAEASYDLLKSGVVMIAAPISSAKSLIRNDVYLSNNGQIVFLESKASKHGDRFSIVRIGVFHKSEITNISIEKIKFFNNFKLVIPDSGSE